MSLVLEECFRAAEDLPQAGARYRAPSAYRWPAPRSAKAACLSYASQATGFPARLPTGVGGHPALLGIFLVSPWGWPGDPVVVDLTCHGGCPCPSHLLVPLPRDFWWVHHATLARSYGPAASSSSYIWKVAQFGTALSGSGGRSRFPRSVGRVVLHPERVSAFPAGGGRFSKWRLEGIVAGARTPWAAFHALRRITGSYIGGEFGPASVPKTLLDNIACLLRR